ncbi:hypothetical protein ACOSQ4_028496 [Xanthoceras sorbifolium]
MIREGETSTRPPLLDGSNYTFWKARMRAYLKANDKQRKDLPRFPNKTHGHHKFEFCTCFKGRLTDGGFKSANAKRDYLFIKFDNDKGKNKGV